jgi:hypothetical protein
MNTSIPKFKINVTQGVIHVNSVGVRQATSEVILFIIDCKQKYPIINGFGSGSSKNGRLTQSVYIGASEHTLGVDQNVLEDAASLELTRVEIEMDEAYEYQISIADAGRYSIHFALIKVEDDSFDDLYWEAKEDQ